MSEALQIQLRKGVLEMCVLALLSREDGYAYDIAARLAELIGMGEAQCRHRRLRQHTFVERSGRGPHTDIKGSGRMIRASSSR
jgi:PadR family transcriptional regulator, regulatory protein PadR